jgi:Bacterial Ig-like domain (group 3)
MKWLFGVALSALIWMVCGCTLIQAQTQNHYVQQVQKAEPTLTLTSTRSPSNISDGTAAVIQIFGTGPIAPTGTVTFSAAQAGVVGTLTAATAIVPIDSTGRASWVFDLNPGTYQLFATYNGDTDYNQVDAIPISQQVIGPADFSLTLDPGSLIVKQGSTWNGSLTATAINNFQGTITLSCDGGGSGVGLQCMGGGQSIQMDASGTSHFPVALTTTATIVTTLSASFLLFISGFGLSKKNRLKKLYPLALLSLLLLVAGCTAVRYQQTDGTPRGTYKLTFVGQSGSLSHAVTVVVTVQ